MDLINAGWRSVEGGTALRGTPFEGGRTITVPANYGTQGSLHINDWTPTYVPPNGSEGKDPRIPQWNRLAAIDFDQYVLNDAELSALTQAGLVQSSNLLPATFIPPGTASIAFD